MDLTTLLANLTNTETNKTGGAVPRSLISYITKTCIVEQYSTVKWDLTDGGNVSLTTMLREQLGTVTKPWN